MQTPLPADPHFETLRVRPLNPLIGAEISGVDITRPLSALQAREIAAARVHHSVIFFRDQPLAFESQVAFARHFGAPDAGGSELDPVASYRDPVHREIVAIHADAQSKFVAGEDWHSDMTCEPEPPLGSMLHLHTVPPAACISGKRPTAVAP